MDNKTDDTTYDYKELVIKAEAAVAAVKDTELRKVAFERILDRLLSPAANAGHTRTRNETSRATFSNSNLPKAKKGPTSYVEELIKDGFFKQQRTIGEVRAELANHGHHVPTTSLSGPLQTQCQHKRLRREKGKNSDKTTIFCYSEW